MREWQKGETNEDSENELRQIKLQQLMMDVGSEGLVYQGYNLRKVKKSGREAFKRQCLAGHRPWRADCRACLDAMSDSRPHRRMQRSRACALSIDISGPDRAEGTEDHEVTKPKYLLVGAYTFPVFDKAAWEVMEGAKIPTPEEFEREGGLDADDGEEWETPEEAPSERALTAAERKHIEEDNKRWENIIATCKDTNYKLIEIPMGEVLPSGPPML